MGDRFKSFKQQRGINGSRSKVFWVISIMLLFLLGCAISSWFLINAHYQQEAKIKKPTIALVNEDQSGKFEGVNYQFGRSFVDRVSNDNNYNWQVVSRSVADKAYSDGSVQAVIYLPQNFTHNILTLQAIEPQKAFVDYKLSSSKSALSNSQLKNKINNVLYQFNTSIVKMYYASVAGNVAEAQNSMKNVVTSQDNVMSQLDGNIYNPFQSTNQSYGSVISLAGGLKNANDSWIQSQNNFTKSVTNMLDTSTSELQGSLPTLTDSFNTQNTITNTNLSNANLSIAKQSDSDNTYYFGQYTTAYDKAVSMMKQFDDVDSNGSETGVYADLKQQISQYNDFISGKQKDIQTQITNLKSQQSTLLNLEKQLYDKFFAHSVDPNPDNTDFTSLTQGDAGRQNAKKALSNILLNSFDTKDNISSSNYPTTIRNLLVNPTDSTQSISVDVADYQKILSTLRTNGSISDAQKARYEDELSVLKNYATEFGIDTPKRTFFDDVPTSNGTNQKVTKTITVTVPASTKYTLSFTTSQEIGSGDVTVDTSNSSTGQDIDYSNPQAISLDNSAQNKSKTYKVTYLINLKTATQGDVNFEWGDNQNKDSIQDIFTLVPANSISDYAGGANFGEMTRILNNIDTASSLVAFLYGKPGATYRDILGTTNFVAQADADSIFKMYGNIKKDNLTDYINDKDVTNFIDNGVTSIKSVTDSLDTLKSALNALNQDQDELQNTLPSNFFSKISNQLNQWYSATQSSLDSQYKAWTKGNTDKLSQKEWSQRQADELALYSNNAGNESLYKTITNLVDSSAKQSKETASSAQVIKSNADDFDALVKETNQTQESAKKVLNNTGNLLATGSSDLKKGKTYYSNFSTVLANTRDTNANPSQIFNFFAQPLKLNNQTPQGSIIKNGYDWRNIILLIIGLLVGLMIGMWISHRQKAPVED